MSFSFGYTNSRGKFYAVDDVAFMKAMIAQIEANPAYSIDPKRIYIVGVSNGATMAMRMAREMSDTVAAVGIALGGDGASEASLKLVDQCAYAPKLPATARAGSPTRSPIPCRCG